MLRLITSTPGLFLLAVLTLALCVGVIAAPRFSARARATTVAARISPLWLLPSSFGFIDALLGGPLPLPDVSRRPLQLAFLLVQLGLSAWVSYRYRRWPWVAVPLAAILLVWSGIALFAIAHAGIAG